MPLQISANTVTPESNGGQILEGDVRIVIPRPSVAPLHAMKVRKSPMGEVTTEATTPPETLTLRAEKVTITPIENGGSQLEWDNGTIDEL